MLDRIDFFIWNRSVVVLSHFEWQHTLLLLGIVLSLRVETCSESMQVQPSALAFLIVAQDFIELPVLITNDLEEMIAACYTCCECALASWSSSEYPCDKFTGFVQHPERQRMLNELRQADDLTHFRH